MDEDDKFIMLSIQTCKIAYTENTLKSVNCMTCYSGSKRLY